MCYKIKRLHSLIQNPMQQECSESALTAENSTICIKKKKSDQHSHTYGFTFSTVVLHLAQSPNNNAQFSAQQSLLFSLAHACRTTVQNSELTSACTPVCWTSQLKAACGPAVCHLPVFFLVQVLLLRMKNFCLMAPRWTVWTAQAFWALAVKRPDVKWWVWQRIGAQME